MNAGILALILGLGVGAWVFKQMSHRSNDNRTGIIIASVVGVIAAFIFFTVLKLFIK